MKRNLNKDFRNKDNYEDIVYQLNIKVSIILVFDWHMEQRFITTF